jgi:hypothetical protein
LQLSIDARGNASGEEIGTLAAQTLAAKLTDIWRREGKVDSSDGTLRLTR